MTTPTPTRELVVDVPRTWWLTSNQRLHYRTHATRTANLRNLALAEARHQGLERGLNRVRVVAHLTYPDRRRRDALNAWPTVKALIDGALVDHGVIPDDNDHHLVGPDHRPAGITPGRYTVRLVVHPLEEGDAA